MSWSRILTLVVLPVKLPCLIVNLEEQLPRHYVSLTILGWWRNCQTYRAHCVCRWPCSLQFAGLVPQINVGLVLWAVHREKLLREGNSCFFGTDILFLTLFQYFPLALPVLPSLLFLHFESGKQQAGVKQQAEFFTNASAWFFCRKTRSRSILLW